MHSFQIRETVVSTIARINIYDDQPTLSTSDNAYVGIGPGIPPLTNLSFVSHRVFQSMKGPWVLAHRRTFEPTT
jgi:hypothetical protein